MSAISNRRAFLEAAQVLGKSSSPTMDQFQAVTQALAQMFTDETGVNCRVSILGSAEEMRQAARRLRRSKIVLSGDCGKALLRLELKVTQRGDL